MKIQAARICIQFAVRSTELATFALVALLSASAHAGETWDGGGADNNWTTDANWNANCPICLDSIPDNDGTADIRMAGTTRLTPRVDVDWDIDSLTFNNTAGAFSISGDPGVSLGIGAGGITNNDAQLQLLLLPIALNASQTWNAAAGPLSIGNTVAGHPLLTRTLTLDGANNIQIAGAITNGAALNKTGAGTLTFNGLNTNTYTGTTTVSAGTLALGRTGGPNRAIPGNLVIGDGAGGAGADVVRLDSADQITEAAGRTVTVGSSGLLNLNGFNETVANLAINGGSVSGAGTLTVNGAITTGASTTSVISSNMAGDLTINGAGTLELSGTTSINITTATINGGTLLLNKSGGGNLISTTGILGESGAGNGTVTVTGAGSTWTNSGSVYVGGSSAIDGGNGTLSITNQGLVDVGGTLKLWPGGNVVLDGGTLETASLESAGGTFNWTSGTLRLGSDLSVDPSGPLGGSVAVGTGKVLEAGGDLYVGDAGAGTLTIANGAVILASPTTFIDNFVIGAQSGSSGTVLIDGGSLGMTDRLIVGAGGSGSIHITNGGYLEIQNPANHPFYSTDIGVNPGVTGSVIIDDGRWRVTGGLSIGDFGNGTVEIHSGFVEQYPGPPGQTFNVSLGEFAGSTGSLLIDGPARWSCTHMFVGKQGTGLLSVGNGGRVGALDIVVGALGTVQGDGTINAAVENNGIVAPGFSAGALHLERNYVQSVDGELRIELGAAGYDQLLITETATINGRLTVNLLDGFVPSVGQSFTLLTADDIDGTFAIEVFPSVPNLGFDVIYNPNSVVLTVAAAGLSGDYNGNLVVNAADYVLWRNGGPLLNDATPGVQSGDYDVWRAHFGQAVGSGAAASSDAAVPEPSTLVTLMCAAASWRLQRRRDA